MRRGTILNHRVIPSNLGIDHLFAGGTRTFQGAVFKKFNPVRRSSNLIVRSGRIPNSFYLPAFGAAREKTPEKRPRVEILIPRCFGSKLNPDVYLDSGPVKKSAKRLFSVPAVINFLRGRVQGMPFVPGVAGRTMAHEPKGWDFFS